MSLSILALRTRENKLEEVTLELLGKAKTFYKEEINIILPTGNSCSTEIITQLEQAGASKIYLIKNEKLEYYSTNFYKKAVLKAIEKINPEILLIGATANGRDLAPRISAFLQTGLTADCTELSLDENGKLAATRPTFGGSLMATILSRKTPQMATVRPKVFSMPKINIENQAIIEEIPIDISENNPIEEVNFVQKTIDEISIEEAQVIIAVGKGIKTKENFEKIKQLAKLISAKVAATRGLVEAGFCQNNIQVGQTGKTVAPKIYIACGISGAIQHIEGMKNSQTIIAINNDENAPIFKIANYKMVADLNEIIPKLIEQIKRD